MRDGAELDPGGSTGTNAAADDLAPGVGPAVPGDPRPWWRRPRVWLRVVRDLLSLGAAAGTAFGSLMLSSHPGTASMGKLLALSLFFTLVAAFFIVPAFLGPPPAQPDARRPEGEDAGKPPAADKTAREPAGVK